MRMKAGTRVIFTLYILVFVLLCLFLLGTMFGLIDSAFLQNTIYTLTDGAFWFKFLYAAIIIVLLIVGISLLFFGIKKEEPKTAIISQFEHGSIYITVKAIEELVVKYLRGFDDIKGNEIKVKSHIDTVDIDLKISVIPDADIPKLTKSLQEGLINSIQGSTGIKVNRNEIKVMGIEDTAKTARVE